MRFLAAVSQPEVWQHWKAVENFDKDDFRSDIRSPLPGDLTWSHCSIESADLERLFIITSGDWTEISGGTFRVADVAARLDLPRMNADTLRISNDIKGKMEYLEGGGELDTKLIAVSHDSELRGPFTFIEGNRRSVALHRLGQLEGTSIYVGLSSSIVDYPWAKAAYRGRR